MAAIVSHEFEGWNTTITMFKNTFTVMDRWHVSLSSSCEDEIGAAVGACRLLLNVCGEVDSEDADGGRCPKK